MPTDINNPEYFPSLNEIHLKDFARQVVSRFSHIPITQVALYHYANKNFPDRTIPTKYEMVFKINHTVDLEKLEKFEVACGQRSTLREDPTTFFKLTGGRPFSRLYKRGITPKGYLYEWRFIAELENKSIAPRVLEADPYWILFRDENSHLQSLITNAKPEVEALYTAIKEIGFSGYNTNDEKWQEVALKHFDENQEQFSLVEREYLEDKNLFAFAGGQEARDFKGYLLQKICEEKGLGKKSARNLAELHRQNLSKK